MTPARPQVATRRFDAADVDEVLDVLRAALGETPVLRRTPQLWDWKHTDSPFGPSTVLVATVGDRIAGVRAVMRWQLDLPDGSSVACGRMVDTATHPDFQRMGIFRRLTNEVVEEVSAEGIELLFNTPNARSGAGYLSMGWERVGPIGVMVRPSPRVLARLRGGAPGEAPMGSFLRSWSDPAGVASVVGREPLGARTPRTPEYLRWRFSGHPGARYAALAVGGSAAVVRPNVRSGRRELVVSELLGPEPRSAARAVGKASSADYLVGWFSPRTPERRAAVGAGLVPVPRVEALTLVARPLVAGGPDVHNPAWWDLAMGDLELL